ncbi:MAG: OmpA family protein [Bacteroidales bacterium]|nr:OmpA family protein [Bacteroidales bacterium]
MKHIFIFILVLIHVEIFAQQTPAVYAIENLPVNTEYSEFSASELFGDLVFISDAPDNILSKKDKNTNRHFCDVKTNSESEKLMKMMDFINTKFHEGPLVYSLANNTLVFTRSAYFGKTKRFNEEHELKLQLYYCTWLDDHWSEIKEVPVNSTEYSNGHPSFSEDGNLLYFVSDKPGGFGGTDIYKIQYTNGIWGKSVVLSNHVNTDKDELFPFIDKDENLYFSRFVDTSGLDVFCADLNTTEKAQALPAPINSKRDDFAFFVAENKNGIQKGYLSSNREGGKGNDDIYSWENLVKPLKIRGIVSDTKGNIVQNASIDFTDDTGVKTSLKTNPEGKYEIKAVRDIEYRIEADHTDYFNDEFSLLTDVDPLQEFIQFDIVLEDYPIFSIRPINEEGTPIVDMDITIFCEGDSIFSDLSEPDGIEWEFPHTYRRGDSIHLLIDFRKKSYLNKKVEFAMVIEDGGEVVIPREQLVMIKAQEKLEISKLIDLAPIYYDFAKWNIREDAATELDKVIEFLNNNPDISIELSSHTDCRGSYQSNMRLSDKRAKSAADYIHAGVENSDQIYGKGYGESKPIFPCNQCSNCTEDEHAANRRTEFTIVKVNE